VLREGIKSDEILTIGCDPVLKPEGTEYDFRIFKSRRIVAPVYEESVFKDADLWLITHGYADHIDSAGISKINYNLAVLSEKNAERFFESDFKLLEYLTWDREKTYKLKNHTITVKAIPAMHGSNFLMRTLAGRVNGYLLSIDNSTECKRVYITSDTVYTKKIARSIGEKKIDLMIVNLGNVQSRMFGGPLTMDIPMLKKVISDLKPEKTIPVHYDDFTHYTTKSEDLRKRNFTLYPKGRWHAI
jgi:L-ascorbate metabolism protein UlaG (beta-lactamase superfamily)